MKKTRMTAPQREAIKAHYLKGDSIPEAAAATGWSQSHIAKVFRELAQEKNGSQETINWKAKYVSAVNVLAEHGLVHLIRE